MSLRFSRPGATAALAAGALLASPVIAAPTPMLTLSRSIEVAAPVDQVWAVIGNFGDLGYFSAAVERTEIVGGENNRVGARRRIVLKDGGIVLETLLARREKPHRLTYRMDEGPLPVADYRATLSVIPAGRGAKVTWRGRFRARHADGPANPSLDGTDALEVMTGLYEGGLTAIKQAVELGKR